MVSEPVESKEMQLEQRSRSGKHVQKVRIHADVADNRFWEQRLLKICCRFLQ